MDQSIGPDVYRTSSPTAFTKVRIPRQLGDSNRNAVPEVNYPILFLGTVAIAIGIFVVRQRTKNVFVGTPVLTVHPSTEADMSQIANIQHLVNVDLAAEDAKNNLLTQ